MQVITNEVHENRYLTLNSYYNPDDVVIFDIETTGFAAETTTLYLIGCAYCKSNKWYITQWFNDDGSSGKEIIINFFDFICKYKLLIHYNGDGFDIPYITKKIKTYGLNYSFSSLESIDIYKNIKPFKNMLHLDNLKQKSIELFLGINRLDKYSGGDLIKIYREFIKNPDDTRKKLLIQHNYEDIEGLLYCCSMLAYTKLLDGCLSVEKMSVKDNKLVFSLSLDYELPKRITIAKRDILITGYQSNATITVPIISEELKFYLDDYREYYYLPAEDTAVHKSVASYVDKNYRVPAKRETCYLKRNGLFITQLNNGIVTGYKRNYKDKESYIELADSFLQNMDLLNAYARHVIKLMLTCA